MEKYILQFRDLSISDLPKVGGKNSSLGEMFNLLGDQGIKVPDGFATTSSAFWHFYRHNNLQQKIGPILNMLDRTKFSNLRETGLKIRHYILNAAFPIDLRYEIILSYKKLCERTDMAVAVRSSATAEDLPNASFAGQHESYLNVAGEDQLIQKIQQCFASLYTDRAIKYREDNHFEHEKVALSVGVQKMVRSDLACSGIGFTLEPESGFRDLVHISGVWGLGENIVQGTVTPDEFYVFKPSLAQGKKAIIQKKLGSKDLTLVYNNASSEQTTINIHTPEEKRNSFVLTDDEIEQLSSWAVSIEQHYQKPMDIEWAKDGLTNELYIIQARPETVQSRANPMLLKEYKIAQKGNILVEGLAVGSRIVSGKARVLASVNDADELQDGEIVVTDLTSPDWDPLLKKAAAIVTNKGGRTSHASIVARELGVPAVVGTINGTESIVNGQLITVSCCEGKVGFVYQGQIAFNEVEVDLRNVQMPESTDPMMIIADPDKAFKFSFYPNCGVGLLRMEFIITHFIQAHPMALVRFNEIKDAATREKIQKLTANYPDKKEYFIEKLSQGIGTIAAAFYPKDVIVRMSDFKTNEYANLLGGKEHEPSEENPMIGFRGASRYYNDLYKDGFGLECKAIKLVREKMGLSNVKVMIPFCRTVEEGKKVVEIMKTNGLDRDVDNTLEIYVMAEIPSNVLQGDEFAEIFDGFSIGSNDLTQLTLGIDRDSSLVADLFTEQNKSAKIMISMMIEKAKAAGVKIGLCGQAPSDFPEYAQFLVEQGIDSISFTPDALLTGIQNIHIAEQKITANESFIR